ncbi:MAG: hypothetical protein OEM00_09250, partial [Burkholderiaceae bacterium]|nr:hypothetical protein [Burkholderiaceae bacterium]
LTPAADVGDTLATALNPALGADQSVNVVSNIANLLDVDLHRVDLNGGDQLTVNMSNAASLYAYARIFDAAGNQLQLLSQLFSPGSGNAPQSWVAPSTGIFYVGISGYSNTTYDPNVADSGNNASYTGNYTLSLERLAAGSHRLSGITASAASGTPADANLPAANTGQTITLSGVGLVATDRVVFTTIDANGNLSDQTLTPTDVDVTNQTLTVVVPDAATTGRVRLERDQAGLMLQIVPTLSDVTMGVNGSFIGSTLTLSGSGFAEAGTAVLFGAQRVDPLTPNYGINVFNTGGVNHSLNLTVPATDPALPTGPIRVSTVGGTSAAFALSLISIDANATSGTAADAGQASAHPGQVITLNGVGLDASADVVFETIDAGGNRSDVVVRPVSVNADNTQVQVTVPNNAVTGKVRLVGDLNATEVLLQIVPTVTDLQVESVAGDGSTAQVLIAGLGFVEGANSEYRFGTQSVLDAGASTGPDVFGRSDAVLGFVANGYARVTVPLSDGVFGAINVKTAGGTSANYTVSLSNIDSVALSGTPADANEASANAGQAVTLEGVGLSTSTDVLLRWVHINGSPQTVRLSPSAAAADGTSATLLIPGYANGAFSLQIFGSSAQPLLQIVPTLSSYDVTSNTTSLFGSGFVEGAGTYDFAGASVDDDGGNIDVTSSSNQNERANLNTTALPRHGIGDIKVTTAGGTSALLNLNLLRVDEAGLQGGQLGDVAIDPSTGDLWVSDYNNPGHLKRIDPASGEVLQTITLTSAFGLPYTYNYAGLQILDQAVTLGATNVPAGSLLVFNGYVNPDRVIAVDPSNGAVIASLVLGGNYDLTAGIFDPTSGNMLITAHNGNALLEIDPSNGAQIGSPIALPVNVQSWAGLAIDPVTGNLWVGSSGGGTQVVEITRTGTEVRRVDISAQGVNQGEISGLVFGTDGKLYVASTNGAVYKVDPELDSSAIATATLSQVIGTATDGVAANAGQAAANVGQVIELVGTNFGAGTRALFNTRDSAGNTSMTSVAPLAINDAGTRMQVLVPNLASTGDVRVVNQGWRNLGFSGSADAVYRNVNVSFTAGSANATVRFADGGLQSLADESWGIDNVVVRQGATPVFADDFENGANAAWSNAGTDASDQGVFTRFSGRFNNASQTLNLTGLTAGQTYDLSFDLIVLDSWEGSNGPDLIDVSVDGVSLLNETLANTNTVQTFRASDGIRLQIVPTLTGTANGRPGEDNTFNLIGSGFMEGANTVSIGGVAFIDSASNLSPFDVTGSRNDNMSVVAIKTLDGPIR